MATAACFGMLASRPACLSAAWRPLLAAARRAPPLQAALAGAAAGVRHLGAAPLQEPTPGLRIVRPSATASGGAPEQAGRPSGTASSTASDAPVAPALSSDIDSKIHDASVRMRTFRSKAVFKLFMAAPYAGSILLFGRVVPGMLDTCAILTIVHEGHLPSTIGLTPPIIVLIWLAWQVMTNLLESLDAWTDLMWLKWQQRRQGQQQQP